MPATIDRCQPDALDRYLAAERSHGFEWGALNADCMLFLCGWVHLVKRVDFGADWRGHYRDRVGAAALIAERGGLVAVVDHALGPSSLMPVRRGDIGLFMTDMGEMGMISTGSMWAARREGRGVATFRGIQPFAHWAVGFA